MIALFSRWTAGILSRPAQFLLLATLQSIVEVYGWTLASSIFLARAGAEAIPIYYMLFAAVSVPLALVYSAVIDRWPRIRLFQAMWVIFVLMSFFLAFLADAGIWGCYVAYLGISVGTLMLYSTYFVLIADYFTVTESKRLTGPAALAKAVGGLAGAGLIALLTRLLPSTAAMLVTPLLAVLPLAQVYWLERREKPLGEPESAAEEGLLESVRLLPRLARAYPIVPLLAAAIFLNIFLQCLNEYLAFSIYAAHFRAEADLAAFMGLLASGLAVFGILLAYFFTDRLLPRLGVARMNMFYPAINMAAFLAVAGWSRLPSGILAHIAYDPAEHSLNVPVFAINYNALPNRFVGRIRVINDGIVYPLALVCAGLVLLGLEHRLSLRAIALGGAGLSVVLMALHWRIGRRYLHGLMEMLRQGSIDFSALGEGLRLPEDYAKDIRSMLQSADSALVIMGLELAARLDGGIDHIDLERALPAVPSVAAGRALGRISARTRDGAGPLLHGLLTSPNGRVRALALEALARRHVAPANLAPFQSDPEPTVRAVAAAVMLSRNPDDPAARRCLTGITVEDGVISALEVLKASLAPAALPIIRALADHPAAAIRQAALDAAGRLAPIGDPTTRAWAEAAAADPADSVAAAAAYLLILIAPPVDIIDIAAKSLARRRPEIGHAAAAAMGARGAEAIPAASSLLHSPDHDVRTTAIEALGKIGGSQAERALFDLLEGEVFPALERNLDLQRRLPADRPGWLPLSIAVADRSARIVALVMQVLGVLECRHTLTLARSVLKAADPRTRANALETLVSMPLRRYILPLLPIFEQRAGSAQDVKDARAVLGQALAAEDDPWTQAGAAIAWQAEFGVIPAVPGSARPAFLSDTLRCLESGRSDRPFDKEAPMNRLVFLKSLPLFSGLTLDNLMDVDAALKGETFLAGETIVAEGDVGETLYIVFRGQVAVRKAMADGQRELARLGPGQLFGEMGLIDQEPRSATVVAVEEVEMLTIDTDRFHSLVHQRPDVLMELCRMLIGRLRKAIA